MSFLKERLMLLISSSGMTVMFMLVILGGSVRCSGLWLFMLFSFYNGLIMFCCFLLFIFFCRYILLNACLMFGLVMNMFEGVDRVMYCMEEIWKSKKEK